MVVISRLQYTANCVHQLISVLSFQEPSSDPSGAYSYHHTTILVLAQTILKAREAEAKPIALVDALRYGICLLTEDRKHQGLVLNLSVRENFALPNLSQLSRGGFVRRGKEREAFGRFVDSLRIKLPHQEQPARNLSGGNQQKVVIGKWLALSPQILLLDEPTRGIDIGAKHEIYEIMDELARQQVAILFVSSEMEEILGLSDRVLVMHEGRLSGTLERDQLSEESVMNLATGAETAS